jgi:hypothetical protein
MKNKQSDAKRLTKEANRLKKEEDTRRMKESAALINERIMRTYDPVVEAALTNEALYHECETKPKVQEWKKSILDIHKIMDPEEHFKAHLHLTNPMPGTLGVVRGNRFNHIVFERLLAIRERLDSPDEYILVREKDDEHRETPARPDWSITHVQTGRCINGLNQVDVWNGGHQNDRAELYIKKQTSTDTYKLLSVIANKTTVTNIKNKKGETFSKGFERDTLCYVGDLERIVRAFFNLT